MTVDQKIDFLLNDMSRENAEEVKDYQEEINEHFAELSEEELSLSGQEE